MEKFVNTGRGCQYFPDCYSCRNCEFSFAPELFDGGCRVRPTAKMPKDGDILRISGTPFFVVGDCNNYRTAMQQAIADLKAFTAAG